MSSCKKFDFSKDCGGPSDQPKVPRLKQMIWNDKSYTFYYNKQWLVDSIRLAINCVTDGLYTTFYEGNRISSVDLILKGGAQGVHTEFRFDNLNRIDSFHHNFNRGSTGSTDDMQHSFRYDLNGRISTELQLFFLFPSTEGQLPVEYVYEYNPDSDVIYRSISFNEKAPIEFHYTYDNKINPLYYIKDGLALFIAPEDEEFVRNLGLSNHNCITVNQTEYLNEYNSKGQLIRKSSGSFSDKTVIAFSYYN